MHGPEDHKALIDDARGDSGENKLNWIDKQDLDTFARMNGAEDKLPRLVSELILATSQTPDAIRFPSDGAGRIRGSDGVLDSLGSKPFVPAGRSYWEFGCGKDLARKARDDFVKRTGQVADAERAHSTFVFVSPLHYDHPRESLETFVAGLSAGSGWGDVRVYDGAKLRHWLDLAPAVAARWAKFEMGAHPVDALSIEEFWQDYSSRFENRLVEKVLLAGRKAQADELISRLARLEPDRIPIQADSQDEAVAFAIAAIRRAEPATRAVLEARTLIVNSMAAARAASERSLVFIPVGIAINGAGLLFVKGPTVLALGRVGPSLGGLILPRPPRHEFAEALMEMGLGHGQATQVAAECGRSVTVLARRRPSATAHRPTWGDIVGLVPALLAGGWDASNVFDTAVLTKLAGASAATYPEWQTTMQPLLQGEDPALEHEGTVWKIRAPVDAFVTLGRHVGPNHFALLKEVALEIFSDRDANARKTPAEQLMSGAGLKHSAWLREGIATSLLMTATFATAAGLGPALATAGGPQAWVDAVVGSLPGLDSDVELLASLAEALPLLAEAAPLPFVTAVDRMVRRTPEAVAMLFQERVEFISRQSNHVWLLWALEGLAWDAAMLTKVCVLLARLAAVDPGGKLTNRPIQSLRDILLPWLPHTDADLGGRLGALTAVLKADERVGWELVLMLLPEHHAIVSMTHRPKLREAGDPGNGAPPREADEAYRFASGRAIQLVGVDQARWLQLIDCLPNLASADFTAAVVLLDSFLSGLRPDEREVPWLKVRALVGRHSGVPDADWAMNAEATAALAAIVDRWVPEDFVLAATLLFDDPRYGHITHPPTAEVARILEARSREALRGLVETEGHQGLLKVASATRSAWAVGAMAAVIVADVADGMELCFAALAEDTPALKEFAVAVSAGMAMREPQLWVRSLESCALGMRPVDVGALLLGLTDGPSTWDLAESLGPAVETAYWRTRQPWPISDPDTSDTAARKFLSVGRGMASLSTLDGGRDPPIPLVFAALDLAVAEVAANPSNADAVATHHVERVFEALRKRPDVEIGQLARREFAWFPLLAGPGRPLRDLALFEVMAQDPTDFLSFLNVVFGTPSSVGDNGDLTDKVRWRAAYNVLQAFRTVPGAAGSHVDGVVLGCWVRRALEMLGESDIADIGAQYIGKVLAHAPTDPGDGAWPAVPVRNLLEDIESDHVETGMAIERLNMRGVFSKGLYDGGTDEREFARDSRSWAGACAAWPRTADLLSRIAIDWDHHADREDTTARQRKMRD